MIYADARGAPCPKKESFLGSGCFGKTYRMRHAVDQRLVAVKQSKQHVAGVSTEAKALAAIPPHPHVIAYYDSRIVALRLWLVMELVGDGTTVHPAKHSSWAEAITQQVSAALAHVHRHGIIHRDVKHSNVLLRNSPGPFKKPHAVLTDFGLARATHAGGTYPPRSGARGHIVYRAPEVAAGRAHGPPSDMWQLGILVLELATGVTADEIVGNSPSTGYHRTIAGWMEKDEDGVATETLEDAPRAVRFLRFRAGDRPTATLGSPRPQTR